MKRLWLVSAVACPLLLPCGAFAQPTPSYRVDHVEAGVLGEFYRVNQTGTNLFGVGARLGFNVASLLQLEAETTYDFSVIFTENFSNGTFQRSNMRRIDGLFGPKLQTNRGPVRLFLTAKGGATSFGFSSAPATVGTFFSEVSNLRTSDVIGEFYPGGGAEAFFGPIGLRFDVGDEIYFSSGAHNNLRMTFGPAIRF